jgi:hypothetical protein
MTIAVAEPRTAGAPARALALPTVCALVLLSFTLLPPVRHNARLLAAFLAAPLALAAWTGTLLAFAVRRRRALTFRVALRAQHYVQMCAHASILLYWGWYWRQVYDSAYLIAAQVVFAYAVDMLIAWSRTDEYTLGFGPVPVVLSTDLFLWFRDDWFAFQFLMIAAGFAGKAFITWSKDGRRAHVFNPSAFTLTVTSLLLIAAGASDLTWGREIAVTEFYPPQMYLFIFLVSLPGQFLFGVSSMTLAAVVTTYLFGLGYFAATGTYFFLDSYIPIGVFLGMHLLFTDPSTSPRSELGRLVFGALYGLSVVGLYWLLTRAGVPAFYDKLLQVPLLNLGIQGIDRAVRSPALQRLSPERVGRALAARQRHFAYTAMWGLIFGTMSLTGGTGDMHPGQWVPFWQQACRSGHSRACGYLPDLETTLCRAGSGWACNELGIFQAGAGESRIAAVAAWERGCELGFRPACENATGFLENEMPATGPPGSADLPILVRGSKGPVTERRPLVLQARACRAGWSTACVKR